MRLPQKYWNLFSTQYKLSSMCIFPESHGSQLSPPKFMDFADQNGPEEILKKTNSGNLYVQK